MHGKSEEITANFLDVDGDVPGALSCVNETDGSNRFGLGAHFTNGIDGAEGVGDVHQSEELDLRCEKSLERFLI